MKTKVLISFAVTAKLICVFVFAYARNRFSRDEAQMIRELFSEAVIVVSVKSSLKMSLTYLSSHYEVDTHDLDWILCPCPLLLHFRDLIS